MVSDLTGGSMTTRSAAITHLVPDHDEAIASCPDLLGFQLTDDTPLPDGKRWVLMAPPGGGPALLLVSAAGPGQVAAIGHKAGGRVFLVLRTEDFAADDRALRERSVRIGEGPREEDDGTGVVFEDGCGAAWDLMLMRKPA